MKDLKQHVSAVPLGLKDFKCSNCDKGFGTHGGLTRHIKTVHEGHKIHICDLCDKAYKTGDHLKAHIARFHEEIKKLHAIFVQKHSVRECIGIFTYAVFMKAKNIMRNVGIVENPLANIQI